MLAQAQGFWYFNQAHPTFWMTLEELESAKKFEDDDSLYQVYDVLFKLLQKLNLKKKQVAY